MKMTGLEVVNSFEYQIYTSTIFDEIVDDLTTIIFLYCKKIIIFLNLYVFIHFLSVIYLHFLIPDMIIVIEIYFSFIQAV